MAVVNHLNLLLAGAATLLLSTVAHGADFVYTPVNPSFGGSPLNSTHMFAGANAQRTATASDADNGNSSSGDPLTDAGTGTNLDFDLFVRQLQSRLLSALSSQVTAAIFGENAQENGTITFGDQQVSFARSATEISLSITDFSTGTTTDIVVPQLVVQ